MLVDMEVNFVSLHGFSAGVFRGIESVAVTLGP